MPFSDLNRVDFGLPIASGTATRNGAVIDTKGYAGTCFVLQLGDVAAGFVGSVKVQGGRESDMSDAVDLAGTGQAINDDDAYSSVVLDIRHSQYRYLRLVVTKDGSNASTEGAVAYQSNGILEPVPHAVGVKAERHHAPAAGTA